MLIAGVVVLCIVLAVLAFLLPRLSTHPQRGVDKTLGAGQHGAAHAPGKLGRWLQKPFQTSRKATNKSAAAGRRGRGRMPF
ncbi:MAG: hypothetical protein JSS99_17995 [Actinobacteria bacterium]|nr:hypothetical protein [Actinomycetota bacterium]